MSKNLSPQYYQKKKESPPPPPPPPKKARERYQNLPKEEKEEK